jgi:trehalose 6-phosphate phosphatase
MEYFFTEPDRVKHLIGNHHLCLFLDYDGTLAPIAQRPQDAVLPRETIELLKSLSRCDRVEVAIISGRALPDIKKLVGLKNITYVGNHGMEIEGPNINFKCPVPTGYKNDLKQVIAALQEAFAGINGVIIEDKGYSISLHYRLVEPEIIPLVKENFEKAVSAYVRKKRIVVHDGKMVLEVRPLSEWNKGKAVLWLLEKKHTSARNAELLAIYIGDDVTDEDAFTALKNRGLTIVVGQPEQSDAQYYLNDSAEVVEFLRQVLEMLRT